MTQDVSCLRLKVSIEIAQILFGIRKSMSGEVLVEGEKCNIKTPRKAISQGIAFCQEDRRREGIIADLTVRENIILAIQARLPTNRGASLSARSGALPPPGPSNRNVA